MFGGTMMGATEKVVGVAVSLVVMPLLLSHVGIEQYGLWVVISSVLGYIGLVQIDVMRGSARFIAFHAARGELDIVRSLVTFASTSFFVLALALTPVAWLVGTYVLPHLGVPSDLALLARNVFLLAFAHFCIERILGPLRALMIGLERFWVFGTANMFGHLVYMALIVVLLLAGAGLYALPIALIVRSVFVAAVCYLAGRRFIGRVFGSPRLDKGVRRALFRFGSWHQVNAGARVINYQTDALLIGAWVNITTVGTYGVAARIADLVQLFPQQLIPPLLPAATAIHSEGDPKRLADVFLQASRVFEVATFAIAGFVLATTSLISTFWLGTTYPQVAAITALLVVGLVVANLTDIGATVLSAMGTPRYETEFAVSGALLNIALTIPLGLAFGLYGILAGTLIGIVVSASYFVWRSHRILKLSIWAYFGDWLWRLATATLLAAACTYAVNAALPESLTSTRGAAALSLTALGVLYGCLLAGGLRALRFFTERDLQLLGHVLPERLRWLTSLRPVEYLFGVRRLRPTPRGPMD